LTICVREHYKKSSIVHTMARFMNLIDGDNEGEKKREKEESKKEKESGVIKPGNRSLDASFLSAFLWVRSKMFDEAMEASAPAHGWEAREQGERAKRASLDEDEKYIRATTKLTLSSFFLLARLLPAPLKMRLASLRSAQPKSTTTPPRAPLETFLRRSSSKGEAAITSRSRGRCWW